MAEISGNHKLIEKTKLSINEIQEIDQKIRYETLMSFHGMVKLGALGNIIGALFYAFAIYNPGQIRTIIFWYSFLFTANIINVLWALRFENTPITDKEIRQCRTGFFCIVTLICLIWSSSGILFISEGQQITTIIFLSAVLICFAFSTAIDLAMSILSVFCLLMPTILYHVFLMVYVPNSENHFHLSVVTAFFVLGMFMLIACFMANRLLIKVFRLGYENALLSEKLSNSNIILEQRVKERTEELEKSLKLVSYQATHDLLTELPNERYLYEHIHAVTERAVKNHHKFAVACFSLNGMMKINDSIGHQAATTIIHRIAQRFANLVRENEKYFISLLRQDVFVILIEPIKEVYEIEQLVQYLFVVLNNPVYVTKQELQLTASIGVSVFPNNGLDIDKLISNAEAARVLATQRGGNSICAYNTVINADASHQLNIENQLYRAIKNEEFILNYQPFIDLRTGAICGAEALIRWKSPVLGLISPLDFIPIAEANGMIVPIGEWVLYTACHQLKKWHKYGFNSFKLSVNLSAKQLLQENLIDYLTNTLNELHLDPKYLELELTESNAFQNETIPIINKLTEMGITLAIDDFGTGYSEFSNLKLFNVDKIKIDKMFIQDLDINIDSRNIVLNTIALANRMDIECLAEGVETLEQINFLKRSGCHIVQGYYFSKPLSVNEFLKYLKKHADKSYLP